MKASENIKIPFLEDLPGMDFFKIIDKCTANTIWQISSPTKWFGNHSVGQIMFWRLLGSMNNKVHLYEFWYWYDI